ncbi:MAG TPA: TraR/DksA C4-type zinc finger protein [Methylobacter sp.]|jgi:phage/conjugal plasmid C-4 type zinc finger TraR family protein
MKGLETLLNPPEHMNEDERIEQAEQFYQDLSLLQHQQATAVNPNAVSAEFCEECGNVIPDDRREAVPGVELCVDCKRAEELKERNLR